MNNVGDSAVDATALPLARESHLEAMTGVTAAAAAGVFAAPFPLSPLLAWIAGLWALHLASVWTAPRRDLLDLLRLVLTLTTWSAGIVLAPPGQSLSLLIGAFAVTFIAIVVDGRRGCTAAQQALQHEQAARREVETAFLQAIEEVRRLRIDVKTGGDVHQHLSNALQETSSEASLLRSKAEALAHTLQRVMPYEVESGLLNAEKFTTVLQREAARMQRQELPLTLVLVKLDDFAEFEKSYGRIAYEAVIRRVSEILHKAGNRPGDVAGRLADNCFALLFPEAEHQNGLKLAEAVRARLLQLGVRNSQSQHGVVTASLGVATILPNSDTTDTTLRERAEAALYEAGFQGGNRCVRYQLAQAIRIEHWDPHNEGRLTPESLRHKLAILGYEGKTKRLKPGEAGRERRVTLDSVEAVIEGTLQIVLEGEARTLRAGDCVYLPKGIVAREEVLGGEPVLCIEGVRA